MESESSKISTEMKLSLEMEYETRVKSLDLNIGYEPIEETWELIIKYAGDLEYVATAVGFSYIKLLANYAVIKIRQENINHLIQYPEILYIDKPKQMHIEQITKGYYASCMDYVFGNDRTLTGTGVLIAVLDSGIDYMHPLFQTDYGSSKIIRFWNQNEAGNSPYNYGFGTEYTQDEIEQGVPYRENDRSGHGTSVAGIAAQCAEDARFIIVKLRENESSDTTRTSSLIYGIDYAIRVAIDFKLPLVINISYGNSYGAHNGTSLLENYIDDVSKSTKMLIVVGTGNDGNTNRHASIKTVSYTRNMKAFYVEDYQTAINLQIWYTFRDNISISLVAPDGSIIGPFSKFQSVSEFQLQDIKILTIYGKPTPINDYQELYIAIIPNNTYITAGIYSVIIDSYEVFDGNINLWLPSADATASNVQFLEADPNITLTIPSTAEHVISVGAYDFRTERYASFSGRGYSTSNNIKPELCAPGVGIYTAKTGGGYHYVSGTSFATPFVSAGAAMLMQWGITEQNDPFLYGDKLKAYLIRGARQLYSETLWPNEKLGYGALCVGNSLNS